MLFYVAPFQATFLSFLLQYCFFYFYDNLDKLKQLFQSALLTLATMSPLILSKLFKLSSINNLVVSSILRELYLSLYHHVKEHL